MLSSFLLELSIFLDHALFLSEHGFIMKTSCPCKKQNKKKKVRPNLSQSVSLFLFSVSKLSCRTKHSAHHLMACLFRKKQIL